jgi:DNA-binding CsgD family transcriptional regulator
VALLERESELGRLDRLLEDARGGEGRLALVEGEAGIGKTALLDALRGRAGAEEYLVLTARGGELEREFPHGVVRQWFEPLLRRPSERRRGVFSGAARLAETALGLGDGFPGALVGADAELAANHGLYWLVANLAQERPVALVLDDAHWADPATLRFVHYLARRLEGVPALVALGLRPAQPGAATELLDALHDLPKLELISLAPLSEDATRALIAVVLSAPPGDRFLRACHVATGGNPFLLSELLRALASRGTQPTDAAAELVGRLGPRSISRGVLGRLAGLWPDAVSLAQAVAVLDTDADLHHAAVLAGLEPDRGAAAADALTAAYVLASGRPLRFAHPILRQAVYEEIANGRRQFEHGRAARVLEAAGEPDRAAVHLAQTEPGADPSVVERLRSAAARALRRGAPGTALTLLRRALAEPPTESARPGVLLETGRAARLAGDTSAVRYLDEAHEQAGDLSSRVEAARELATALTANGDMKQAAAVLEKAIEALPRGASEEQLRLEAELLTASVYDHDLASHAGVRIDHLVSRLRAETPGERLLLAGAAYHRLLSGRGTAGEVATLALRAAVGGLIVSEQAPESAFSAAYAPVCLVFTDRHDEAHSLLGTLLTEAREIGSPVAAAWAWSVAARLEQMRGNLSEAESAARSALAPLPQELTLSAELALAYLVLALVEQGRLGHAEAELSEYGVGSAACSRTTAGLALHLARSALRLAQGRTEEADRDAREAIGRDIAHGAAAPGRGFRFSPAIAIHAAGDRARAVELAEAELRRDRSFQLPSAEGIALTVLGTVKGGEGGLQLLRTAIEKLGPGPRKLELAYALVEFGSALRRANRRSDARGPLTSGMDLAHRCGATPLAERAREELFACGARPRKLAVSGLDSLTASERRVARMAAEGMSNTEIAQALFVTRKTIETHLGHVYMKLDISSRRGLPQALGLQQQATPADGRHRPETVRGPLL